MSIRPQFKTRWYRLYYALAAIDLVAIAALLYFNHQHISDFEVLVDRNQQSIEVLHDLNRTTALIADADLLAGQIVQQLGQRESKVRATHLQELQEIESRLAEHLATLQTELRAWSDLSDNDLARLQRAETAFLEARKASQALVLATHPTEGQRHLRQMDELNAKARSELSQIRVQLTDRHQRLFETFKAQLEASQIHKYIFVGMFVLILGAIVVYGRKLTRVFTHQFEREVQQMDENKKLIHALRLTNERLDFVVEGAGLGTWDWWLNSNDVTFDRRWCEMIGLKWEETPQVYSTWRRLVHPDDLEIAERDIRRHLLGEDPYYENIHRMRHADGSWVWILARGRVSERDIEGRPIRFSGTHLNITEYKESEILSGEIQRLAKIGGWELDLQSQKIWWTEESYRIHKLPVGEPLNFQTVMGFFDPQDMPRIEKCLEMAKAGEKYAETFRITDREGQARWIEGTGEPVHGLDGEVVRLRGTLQDVTDRYEASVRLQSREAYINALFTQSRDPMMTLNPPDWRFTSANQAALDLFGAKGVEDFIGRGPWEVSPERQPNDQLSSEAALQRIQAAMSMGRQFFEWTHQTLDGVEIPCTVLLSRVSYGEQSFLQATVRDISEQKAAELALLRKTRELDQFFAISIDMLCIADLDGRFRRVNPAFSEILGYSEAELTSQSYLNFIHPDDLERTQTEMGRLSDGRSTMHFENRYRCKDGRYRIISWTATPDLQLGVVYAAARDVTLERTRENEMREVMRAIEQSAIVSTLDREGRLLTVNDEYCRISGMRREDLIGQPPQLSKSGFESKEKFAEIWPVVNSGRTWTGELRHRSVDGRTSIVKALVAPVHNASEEVDRFISIRFDLTEQRRLQRQLEEAQRVARIGNWTYDLDLGRFEWSPQLFEILALNADVELMRIDAISSRLHAEDREAWQSAFDHCRRQGVSFRIRSRLRPDPTNNGSAGRTRWIETIGQSVQTDESQINAVTGTCQDITEKVEGELALEEQRIMTIHTAKLASLGEMSAGVAHEINNPLAIINGNLGLLGKHRLDEKKFKEKVATLQRAVTRIAKIVNGLRKFARTTDGETFVSASLPQIAREAIIITETKSKRHGTRVDLQIAPQLSESDLTLYCDPIEIEQVVINLVNNAIDAVKHNDDSEQRWVKVLIETPGSTPSEEVVLRVVDSGLGLAAEAEAKMFDPFFTTKPIGEGTGLGLSISRGIVDRHHGQLTLNKSFANTCFEVRLPRQPRAIQSAAQDAHDAHDAQNAPSKEG